MNEYLTQQFGHWRFGHWLGVWVVFACIFGFVAGKVFRRPYDQLVRNGMVAEGQITATEPRNHQNVYYSYVVGSQTYSGVGHGGQGGIPRFELLEVGQKVQVYYDRNDPNISSLGGSRVASSVSKLFDGSHGSNVRDIRNLHPAVENPPACSEDARLKLLSDMDRLALTVLVLLFLTIICVCGTRSAFTENSMSVGHRASRVELGRSFISISVFQQTTVSVAQLATIAQRRLRARLPVGNGNDE